MSIESHTLSDVRAAIYGALVGNQLSGLNGSPVTLHAPESARSGPRSMRDCVDGGVRVWRLRSTTTATSTPRTATTHRQRWVRSTWRVTVTVHDGVSEAATIGEDMPVMESEVIDLIEAGVEPLSGTRYNVEGWTMPETTQPPGAPDYYEITVDVTIIHPWEREA